MKSNIYNTLPKWFKILIKVIKIKLGIETLTLLPYFGKFCVNSSPDWEFEISPDLIIINKNELKDYLNKRLIQYEENAKLFLLLLF